MGTSYDPDAAVAYALLFWDKACSDGFICLNQAKVAHCTGNPKGDPYLAVASGTKFVVTAGSPPTEEVATPLGKLATDCLADATHFVSCCIGTPPAPSSGPAARGGGYKLRSSPKFPKAPYGITNPTELVGQLEKDGRALVRRSSKRELPAGVRKGDVIIYYHDGHPAHGSLL